MKNLILSTLLLPTLSWAADRLPVEVSLNCDGSYVTRTDEPGSRRFHNDEFEFFSPTRDGVKGTLEFSSDKLNLWLNAKGTPVVEADDYNPNDDGSPRYGRVVFDGVIYDKNTYRNTMVKIHIIGKKLLELLDGSIDKLTISYDDRGNIWNSLGNGYIETAAIKDVGQGSRYDRTTKKWHQTRRLGWCSGSVKKIR